MNFVRSCFDAQKPLRTRGTDAHGKAIFLGDTVTLLKQRKDRALDDRAVFVFHVQTVQNAQRRNETCLDLQQAVSQAAGIDEDLAYGNKVFVRFASLIEIMGECAATAAAQFPVRMADQQGLFGFRQVAKNRFADMLL